MLFFWTCSLCIPLTCNFWRRLVPLKQNLYNLMYILLEVFLRNPVPHHPPIQVFWCIVFTITAIVTTMIIMVVVIIAVIISWGRQSLQDGLVVKDDASNDDLASLIWSVPETVYNKLCFLLSFLY